MLTKEARLKGTYISSINIRKRAIENYYKNPKMCLECNNIIGVGDNEKVSTIKLKNFCNRSCAATYNNKKFKKIKIKKCRTPSLHNITKGELFSKRRNWQSARSGIQRNARITYYKSAKNKCCYICGYDKHIEISHINSVNSFSNDVLISEINNINNLVALCPTHHWEFDNNILYIDFTAE